MSKKKRNAWLMYQWQQNQQKTANWNKSENERGDQADAKAEEYRKRRASKGQVSLLGAGKQIKAGA